MFTSALPILHAHHFNPQATSYQQNMKNEECTLVIAQTEVRSVNQCHLIVNNFMERLQSFH